ncbi:hypothetical protein EAY64_05500 [Aquitalea palustris]|uniref:N-acetyltransferase domain-containing protein n=1 Tax=Aquitalea palustris TaxID=2480983 RepID=A0A454JL12_9NEIS|nr:GNAT family N-acetyltransferase [Aquitalea palustris]RMD00052.1 hypothetical protein EAY64_05500 [Aquitalea palustris]
MAITIRPLTNLAGHIAANMALGQQHYDEIALNKSVMVFAPDLERYQALEEQGLLVCLGAYDGDALIGYSVNIVTNHLHYRDLLCGHNDMIFLAKPYRNGKVGLQLIDATRAACKERGVQFMTWHAKENTALAALLPRLGCRVQDILFSEEL